MMQIELLINKKKFLYVEDFMERKGSVLWERVVFCEKG